MKNIHGNFQVLVVDHSKIITDRISRLLREMTCISGVDIAVSFKEAVDKMNHQHFDIILLDTELPDQKGFLLLAHIKATTTDIKTIVITNKSDDVYRIKGEEMGSDFFIDKSTDFDKIIQIIESFSHDYSNA